MREKTTTITDHAVAGRQDMPTVRVVAQEELGWAVAQYTCRAGPNDRPFEEKHLYFTIAAVVAGSFTYQSDQGRALLYPGALLLGNFGRCFECGHEHGSGDRCVAFHFAPDFLAEIATNAAGSSRYRFPAGMTPALKPLTPLLAEAEAIGRGFLPLKTEETVTHIAEVVLGVLSGHRQSIASASTRDERRVVDVLRYIEESASEALTLGMLAKVANLSKYHFLRMFRRSVGMSPYNFLLRVRMRRAAVRLVTSPDPVATIAFDSGFGDLSTFNKRFRDAFGVSPQAYRTRRLAA